MRGGKRVFVCEDVMILYTSPGRPNRRLLCERSSSSAKPGWMNTVVRWSPVSSHSGCWRISSCSWWWMLRSLSVVLMRESPDNHNRNTDIFRITPRSIYTMDTISPRMYLKITLHSWTTMPTGFLNDCLPDTRQISTSIALIFFLGYVPMKQFVTSRKGHSLENLSKLT